jgi:hypothetical protein
MKHILLLIGLFIPLSSLSQVEVEVLYDDAKSYNIMGQVSVMAETDFDFRTLAYLKTRLYYDFIEPSIEISFIHGFAITDEREKGEPFSPITGNEHQTANVTDIGITYNFIDNTNREPIKIKLGSNRRGNRRIDTYTHFDGEKRHRVGARIGMYRYANALSLYDLDGDSIKFREGLTLPDPIANFVNSGEPNGYMLGQRHASIFIGGSYHRNSGLFINARGFGKRGTKKDLKIYGDILIDLASDIENVSYQGRVYETRDALSDLDQKSMGWRLGAYWSASSIKGHGIQTDVEVGQRPSYFGSSIYFQFGVGYSFSTLL